MSLLDRVRIALGDEEELARLAAEIEANRMKVGDYGWCGPVCLQCTAIDEHGSHRSRVVATATKAHNIFGDALWNWHCPECGMTRIHLGDEIPVRHDPRCDDCRCPPTLRDPGLPPTARDGCAGAAGDANSRE